MKKALNWIGNIVTIVFLLCMALLVFFTIGGKLSPDGMPKFADYKLMVVLSGSMSPAFEAGDVIVVSGGNSKTAYRKGDVITFKDPGDPKRVVTHRVIEVQNKAEQVTYRTKGDANKSADIKPVPAFNVIGQQEIHIPYFGRLVEFSKSRQGFIWLIIIPGAVIILSELRRIGKTITDEIEKKKREAVGQPWSKND